MNFFALKPLRSWPNIQNKQQLHRNYKNPNIILQKPSTTVHCDTEDTNQISYTHRKFIGLHSHQPLKIKSSLPNTSIL